MRFLTLGFNSGSLPVEVGFIPMEVPVLHPSLARKYPINPDNFRSTNEAIELIRELYFHEMKHAHGAFVAIVTRMFVQDPGENCFEHGLAMPVYTYYIGTLASEGQLFSTGLENDPEKGDPLTYMIRTERHIAFTAFGKSVGLVEGPIVMRYNWYTPLTRPLEPAFPLKQGINAFSVAVGIPAIEELFLNEKMIHKGAAQWCLFAARMLGVKFSSEEMRAETIKVEQSILATLLEHLAVFQTTRDKKTELVNAVGRAEWIGLHESEERISVRGIRYVPKELIEDVKILLADP